MGKKENTEVKTAVSLIIEENLSALKRLFRNLTHRPPKTRLYIRKRNVGK